MHGKKNLGMEQPKWFLNNDLNKDEWTSGFIAETF